MVDVRKRKSDRAISDCKAANLCALAQPFRIPLIIQCPSFSLMCSSIFVVDCLKNGQIGGLDREAVGFFDVKERQARLSGL